MSIHRAITISLVAEARGGPFVYWSGIESGCADAAALGFDAVEIFPAGPESVDPQALTQLLQRHSLRVAAFGTGAGWVKHKLLLTDPNRIQRDKAEQFVRSIIDLGAAFKAPAIIGSMQGRWGGELGRDETLAYLRQALNELGEYAKRHDVPLIYEPLNRYETNLVNTMSEGVRLLDSLKTSNVRLLADLFHMNIEEADVASAIRSAGSAIGHVHFADSNRRAAGMGHTDFRQIADALAAVNYAGYASTEIFPLPDSEAAAKQTMDSFRKFFPR